VLAEGLGLVLVPIGRGCGLFVFKLYTKHKFLIISGFLASLKTFDKKVGG
jgi:hypothetical protein